MKAYCQGCADSQEASHLVLAGVVATPAHWADFESRWTPLPGHLFTASPGSDVALSDALQLARSLAPHDFRAFLCAVDLNAYRDLEDFEDLLLSPQHICNHHVPRGLLAWHAEHLPIAAQPRIDFYFDPTEPFLALFQASVRKNKAHALQLPPQKAIRNPWLLAGEVLPTATPPSAPAQLAALFAWSAQHQLEGGSSLSAPLQPFSFTEIDAATLHKMAWSRSPTEFTLEAWES